MQPIVDKIPTRIGGATESQFNRLVGVKSEVQL